ncbi:hypothetical protein MPH_09542 [Macrophomina phaseolina MS6]|uniref:Uncharacterized protein n=1 Tax=Macrophomina phaseolina (strain MS6) TaxID=1126212 RepID=K2QU18_MACPH|nr:hypothetical protein MPH_09542 [Macrophomina phaseolina MS6]
MPSPFFRAFNRYTTRFRQDKAEWRRLPQSARYIVLSALAMSPLIMFDNLAGQKEWNERNRWQKEQLRLARERAREKEAEQRGFVGNWSE